MNDQVLTITQMSRLKELGIDTSKAFMCYCLTDGVVDGDGDVSIEVMPKKRYNWTSYVPTFTLHDILKLLPSSLTFDGIEYNFQMSKGMIGYRHEDAEDDHWANSYAITNGDILNSAYRLLEWYQEYKED